MDRWDDEEMNDKNVLLFKNNSFEYTISLALTSL